MEANKKMNEKEEKDICEMPAMDDKGKTNICCCYILNSEGHFEDPCYSPVNKCC